MRSSAWSRRAIPSRPAARYRTPGILRKSLKELEPEIALNLREVFELTTAALQQLLEGPDKLARPLICPESESCPSRVPVTLQLQMSPTGLLGACSAPAVLGFARPLGAPLLLASTRIQRDSLDIKASREPTRISAWPVH